MRSGRSSASVWAALAATCLALAACGSGPWLSGPSAAESPSPSSPPHFHGPLALSWRVGESFSASADERVTATTTMPGSPGAVPLALDLAMTAEQLLTVRSVHDGVADLDVSITSWRWQRSGSSRRLDVMPPPWTVSVGADGTIRSGGYWGLPDEPPLPGADFFSTGLPSRQELEKGTWAASWARTLDDGTPVVYRVQGRVLRPRGGQAAMESFTRYDVTRHAFTADGQADLVRGSAQAVIRSTFDMSRGTVAATSYTSSFRRLETGPSGNAQTDGTVTTSIRFQY